MKVVKKILKWFNGKKTVIGYIGMTACNLALIKNNINPDALEFMQWGFGIMGGVGVAHKINKSSIQKKLQKNINQNI